MGENEKQDVVLEAFLDFLGGVEAGIAAARQKVKQAKLIWDPDKIKWEKVEGAKGTFERSGDFNNPEFKVMLKDLMAHNGKLTRDNMFYWVYKNGSIVGRKPRKR